MPPSERPGAARMTVESIADTVEMLFSWLAGPDPKPVETPPPAEPVERWEPFFKQAEPEELADPSVIDTDGEAVP